LFAPVASSLMWAIVLPTKSKISTTSYLSTNMDG
jgi:hypothetical protein